MRVPMQFTVRLDKAEEGGYVVQCVEIPGAISQGETQEEALDNIVDAITSILDVRREEAQRVVQKAPRAHSLQTVEVDA